VGSLGSKTTAARLRHTQVGTTTKPNKGLQATASSVRFRQRLSFCVRRLQLGTGKWLKDALRFQRRLGTTFCANITNDVLCAAEIDRKRIISTRILVTMIL
jgi:hypothetical protein